MLGLSCAWNDTTINAENCHGSPMRWPQRYKQFLERKKPREKHGECHAHTGTVLRRSFEDRHVYV
jgi:hypothetical protein